MSTLRVNGHPTGFLIDTGAEVTVLNADITARLGVRTRTPARSLLGPGGGVLPTAGEVEVRIATDEGEGDSLGGERSSTQSHGEDGNNTAWT